MKVLKIDDDGDWTLKILKEPHATIQAIKTRLKCFKNDCYFDLDFGFDLNSFGKNAQETLIRQARAIIASTENVDKVENINFSLDNNRKLTITFNVKVLEQSVSGTLDLIL